tara:strand:- start:67 stop:264 length:198 start_codon:yes stop_codon:yes gene_type:complete
MDIDNTLWLESLINKLERKASDRRDSLKRYWNGYSSEISPMLGTEKSIRDDIGRRERMAEAMYDL